MGGLLAGLSAASLPVQSGQLAGQIQGKQMQMEYGIQLANLMREQELARSEMAKNQAMGGYYTGLNSARESIAAGKNTSAEEIAAQRAETQKAISESTLALKGQIEQVNAALGQARNENQRQQLMLDGLRLQQSLNQFQTSQGAEQTGKVVSDLKPIETQAMAIRKAQQITPEMARDNPAAAQQYLMEAMQAGIGGTQFRAQMASLAKAPTTADPSLWVGTAVQKLATGGISPQAYQNAASALGAASAGLRQQHQAILQQDLSIYPYAAPTLAGRTDAIFGKEGTSPTTPSGSQQVANPFRTAPAAPPPAAPPANLQASTGLPFQPSAGVTAPPVAPPKLPVAPGASATPNNGGSF